jgi:hypothetical protein
MPLATTTAVMTYSTAIYFAPAFCLLGLVILVPVLVEAKQVIDILTDLYDAKAEVDISNSPEHLAIFCDNILGAMSNILGDLSKLIGNINQLIASCSNFSSLSNMDQLSLYRNLSTYICMLDKSVEYLVLNLDIVQDVFNQYLGIVPNEFMKTYLSLDSQLMSYINRAKVLIAIYRDLENGLLLRGIINDLSPDLITEGY